MRTALTPSAVGAAASDQLTVGNVVVQRTESFVMVALAADRHIAAQPLLISDTAYNLRRLSELWYQLLNAGKLLVFCMNHLVNLLLFSCLITPIKAYKIN